MCISCVFCLIEFCVIAFSSIRCGKTTQVPQLVLDDMIFNNRGAEANVIITQPRRISAIGVSERIAAERCEKIGQTCGYSIRLESKRSAKTRLLLCTTGVLLRRLQCDPGKCHFVRTLCLYLITFANCSNICYNRFSFIFIICGTRIF